MICPTRTPGLVLEVSRRIAAELAAEAANPDAGLTLTDRIAFAALALAVDIEASRRAGVEPVAGVRDTLADRLTMIAAADC